MTQEQRSNSYIYTPFLGDVLLKPLSYYCVSTHVSTAYQYTKGPSRVRLTYVSIRSSYSFSYLLSPRLKPKQSATKLFAASEIAAYLTDFFRCGKIAANLTKFAAAKLPLT